MGEKKKRITGNFEWRCREIPKENVRLVSVILRVLGGRRRRSCVNETSRYERRTTPGKWKYTGYGVVCSVVVCM